MSFLCGEMSAIASRPFELHIDACPACRNLLSALAGVAVTGASREATERWQADSESEDTVVEDRITPWSPGTVIGDRFEIEGLARSGGMGAVFRARDRVSGAIVAVKAMKGVGSAAEERFEREAHLLMSLQHPGIVRYVAHGATHEGKLYLAMEWLQGEDLAARLAVGRLTVGESVLLVRRVAEALGAAHAIGIVHRDVKPSNIFLDGGDIERPRVLDFGVARSTRAQRDDAHTRTGMVLGTPGYIAPEQARGRRVDARVDVFALGCVLYECLTGTRAFDGSDRMERLAKALLHEPPRPSDLAPGISNALDDLAARMLAKDPSDRPETCDLVATELAQPIMRLPSRPTRAERRTWGLRERTAWLAAAVLALGLPLASMHFFFGRGLPSSTAHASAAPSGDDDSAAPSAIVGSQTSPLPETAPPPEPVLVATAPDMAKTTPLNARRPQSAGSLQRGSPRVLSPSPSAAKPSRDCQPPYLVDDAGFKHYKRACME